MQLVNQRIFGTSIKSASAPRRSQKLTLDQLRQSLHSAMVDCSGMPAQRLGHKINVSRTACDLWLLRSDLDQCIAQEQGQGVAAERSNGLIPAFEGWLPASPLNRLQPAPNRPSGAATELMPKLKTVKGNGAPLIRPHKPVLPRLRAQSVLPRSSACRRCRWAPRPSISCGHANDCQQALAR